MNSYMTIYVRVVSSQAQAKMAAVAAQTQAVTKASQAAAATQVVSSRNISSLGRWGNQLQWAGRQLQYNFTLPIGIAGIAATKWAMDNEKAFTRVKKVYGDTQAAAKQFMKQNDQLTESMATQKATRIFRQELEALNEAFIAISNQYGVQQVEVMQVASAWAAAGKSGLALAQSVELTMKAMILGELDAAQATEALIAIQAQYNLNTKELTETLAYMNAVENATGATMQDLIIGFQKTAGVAKEAGIDVRHLAAFMAALIPATGSAATAGNALKTIISRLQAPTTDTVDILHEMGINIGSVAWQAATGGEKLEILADKFNSLSDAQKNQVSSVIASRWQLNKFNILMDELGPTFSFYEAALAATHDRTKAFTTMQRELNAVLKSSPQRLQQTWVMLQNALAKAIIPAIPYILYLADAIADLATAFANLDPVTQKFILFGLAFVAVSAMVIRYVGVLVLGFDLLKRFIFFAGGALGVFGINAGTAGKAAEKTAGGLTKLLKLFTITPIMAFGQAIMGLFGLMSSGLRIALTAMAGMFLNWWTVMFAYVQASLVNWKGVWARFTAFFVTAWARAWFLIGTIMSASQTVLIGLWTRFNAGLTRILFFNVAIMQGLWTRFTIWLARVWAITWAVMTNPRLLLANLAKMLPMVAALGRGVFAAFTSPWALAIAAVIALLYTFRDQIAQVWKNIVNYFASNQGIADFFQKIVDGIISAFNALPQGVQNALIAVARVVQAAVLEIYGWLQYLNPFATHSPSLVQNVTQGVDEIKRQFGTLTQIRGPISAATAALQKFNKTTAAITLSARNLEIAQDRMEIRKLDPSALASYDNLIAKTRTLEHLLGRLENRIARQQAVVDRWQAAVDRASDALERQQNKLDRLNEVLSDYQDKLSSAQERLDYFANAPLKGMEAMEDKIFRNEMAQKRLRLEMMRMEDAKGTLEDINQKLADINGEQELLRGERAGLRMAGAGSEILGQYDEELKKLGSQKNAYEQNADALTKMQLKLDALQRQAEKLDLVKALKFDVLQHKIDKMVDTQKELTFQQIVNGIKKARHQVEFYSNKVDQATNAVDRQEKAVDRATKHRDKLQNRLDREQNQLDRIQKRYDAVNDALQDMNTSLGDVTQAAQTLNDVLTKDAFAAAKGPLSVSEATKALADAKKADKLSSTKELAEPSPAVKAFRAAAKGDFPDVGGKGMELRKNWESQVPQIEKFTERLANQTSKAFEDINPFKGWKEKASDFFNWLGDKAGNVASAVGNFFSAAFAGVSFSKGQKEGFSGVVEWLRKFMGDVQKIVVGAWELFGPEIRQTIRNIVHIILEIWGRLGPELAKFGELLKPLGRAFKNAWSVIKPILALILIGVAFLGKVLWSVINDTIMPVVDTLIGILAGFFETIRGFLRISINAFNLIFDVIGLFFDLITGDWKGAADRFGKIGEDVKGILKGIWEVFHGTFKMIWSLVKGVVETVIGLVEGLVTGIVDFFQWLWDKLVGGSIIPDLVHAIIDFFQWMISPFKAVWDKIWGALKWWWHLAEKLFNEVKDFIKDKFGPVFNWLKEKIVDNLGKAWDKITDFKDDVIRGFKVVKDWIEDKLGPVFKWLKDKIVDNLEKAWDHVTDFKNDVVRGFKVIKDWIEDKLGPVFKWIKDKIIDYLGKAWTRIKNFKEDTIDKLGDIVSWFREKFGPAFQWVWEKVRDIWDKVWGKTRDIWDKIWGKISDIIDKIRTGWGNLREAIANIGDRIRDVFGNIIGKVLGFINTLIGGFNRVTGALHLDVHINEINIPQWAAAQGRVMPGYTPGRDIYNVRVGGGEAIMRPEWTRAVGTGTVNEMNRVARTQGTAGVRRMMGRAQEGFAAGGTVDPMRRVYKDGEPITAIHKAQLKLASRLMHAYQTVLQGSWQAASSYSGTSHTGPGVADTSPGSWLAQWAQRRVGIAAWARNIPGAHSAGVGAHVHGVSFYSAPGNSQLADFLSGGDGLGGRDYGPRPDLLPNLQKKLARFGELRITSVPGSGGGVLDWLTGVAGWVKDALSKPFDWLMDKVNLDDLTGHGKLSQLAIQGVKAVAGWLADKMKNFASNVLPQWQPGTPAMGIVRDTTSHIFPNWAEGRQWRALSQLVMHESGGSPTALNEDSGAYGLFQFLPSTWATVGGTKTSDPEQQTVLGLKYIYQRYNNPIRAWNFWQRQSPHWYGAGLKGGLFTRPTLIGVGDRPERVDITPVGRGDRGRSGRVVNINGNLEFPNISDPQDAERFIKNLEALAS